MPLQVFNIVHKESPLYLHDLIDIKQSSFSLRYQNTAVLSQIRTSAYGLKSFRFSAAKLWISLLNDFRSISSFNQFKNVISSWDGDVC